jgi:hypothetical protein
MWAQNGIPEKPSTGIKESALKLPFRREQSFFLMSGKQKAHIEYSLPPISYGTIHEK